MNFSPAFFKRRISEILAGSPVEPDTIVRGFRPIGTDRAREPHAGVEVLSRRVDSLLERLDLFAVESTRRQKLNEGLTRTAIARMDLLLRFLRTPDSQNPAAAFSRDAAEVTPRVDRGANMIIVAEINDHAIGVPGTDWKLASHYSLRGGLIPGLERFLRRHLRPGMVFVDLGAGIGIYTVLAAVLTGTTGSVLSLEPDPAAYRILVWNLERNGFGLEQGVLHQGELDMPGRADVLRISAEHVSTWQLESLTLLATRNSQIHVVLEYCAALTAQGFDLSSHVNRLDAAGFSVRKIDAETGQCVPLDPEELDAAFSTNLLLNWKS